MAIYHLHAQVIGRGKGRSSVAASAYRAACKLVEQIVDKETGSVFEVVHDYSKKSGVLYSKILAPESAPEWCYDREVFWNKVQNEFELRKNSQFCRELDIALPKELTEQENIKLLTEFVYETLVKEGMVADVNFHNDNPENPHAHIMLSTREIVIGEDGISTFGNKVRHWNSNEFLVHTRRMWAGYINKHLGLAGIDQEVSYLSHEKRGINLIPTTKEGIARFVDGADRREINNEIREYNKTSIVANPELVIDQYFRDKTVFTKEEVAKVLFDIYIVQKISSRDENPSEIIEEKIVTQKEMSDYIAALDIVMSSDKVAIIEGRDIYGKQLYTSKDRLDLEKSFFDIANSIKVRDDSYRNYNLNISDEDLDKKNVVEQISEFMKDKASRYLGFDYDKLTLSDQQRRVVLDVVNSEEAVSVIEGLPGTGKTATMREVVRQYKKAGYRVSGCSVSSSAARELENSSGIRAVNITKLRYELDNHIGREFNLNLGMGYYKRDEIDDEGKINTHKSKLTCKDVLIIDESSMVDLAEMHYLLSEAERSGAKLILLGDSNQLPSVGTGGATEKMAEMFGVSRLTEVRRQTNEAHRKATELLSEFQVSEAIKLYRDTGVFKFNKELNIAKDKIVRDYVEEYLACVGKEITSSEIALLAYTNKDIRYLNLSVRQKLCDAGAIRGEEKVFKINRNGEYAEITLARGDKIVFTRNSQYLGIANSDVGSVTGFGRSRDNLRDTIRVKLLDSDKKGFRNIEIDNLHFKGFDYGYALNIYKSQGKSYRSVYGLIDKHIGYNSFNVMATRHRDKLSLYVPEDLLKHELYKKISLDPEQAHREYMIEGNHIDKESAKYAGLVALTQKRVDTSFAVDYQYKTQEEIEVLTQYIEVRNEVIKVRQATDSWLELERAKGRIRQHNDSPYYSDLKPLLEVREKLASIITDNYSDYKKLIAICKLNYNTIEKHAGRLEYQYYFKRIDYTGSIRDIEGIAQVLELQDRISRYSEGELFTSKLNESGKELRDITAKITENIEEHKLSVEKARLDLNDARDENYKAECYLDDGKKYINSQFIEYLDQTFKGGAQQTALKTWESLKVELGKDEALETVKTNPKILGKLNGVGLGNLVALSIKRVIALENLEILPQKLEKYEEYISKIPELESRMNGGEFSSKILDKELALKSLEANLPNKEAQQYIEKALNVSKAHDSTQLLAWANDIKIQAQSNQFRELLASKNKFTNSTLNIERNTKEYIKEREALLQRYEYARGNDNRSKLYRNIAGSLEPDLAYDILKNLCFYRVKEGKAIFILVSDGLPNSRLKQIKKELLDKVQDSISYDTKIVEILTKEENILDKQQEANKESEFFHANERISIKEHLRDDVIDNKDPNHLSFTAGDILKLEIDSERITNIAINQRIKLQNGLKKELSYEEIMAAKEIYNERDARIELLSTKHDQVVELTKVDPIAGKCFAENLVDAQVASLGKILSTEIIEQQKIIAIAQASAIKTLTLVDVTDSTKIGNSKIFSLEIVKEDHLQKTEYVKYELSKNLSQEMAETKSIKLDVAKIQAITNETIVKADQKFIRLQQEYSRNRGQELQQNQQRLLNLNKGLDR